MSNTIILTNQKFNYLHVFAYVGGSKWLCQCVCGKFTSVDSIKLRQNRTKSCGCQKRQLINSRLKGHRLTKSPEYRIFHAAKNRCQRPGCEMYHLYGGRGIEFRFNSITDLIDDIGFRPSTDYSLDRIDTNGHYEKGNVRWATLKTQARNTRRNRFITIQGVTRCMAEWVEIAGINKNKYFNFMRKKPTDTQVAEFVQKWIDNPIEMGKLLRSPRRGKNYVPKK